MLDQLRITKWLLTKIFPFALDLRSMNALKAVVTVAMIAPEKRIMPMMTTMIASNINILFALTSNKVSELGEIIHRALVINADKKLPLKNESL